MGVRLRKGHFGFLRLKVRCQSGPERGQDQRPSSGGKCTSYLAILMSIKVDGGHSVDIRVTDRMSSSSHSGTLSHLPTEILSSDPFIFFHGTNGV